MKDFCKVLFAYAMKLLLLPFRLFPVRNDRLAFAGLTGGREYEYTGSPKYICEYIDRERPGEFALCWIVSEPERYRGVLSGRARFYRHYSLRSFYILLTAKAVVTSGSYAPWFPFRKSQYIINTWHGGGAYKRLKDNYQESDFWSRKKLDLTAKNIDLFLSSCQKATELLFRGAFHYQGEVLEAGTPRNDVLLAGDVRAAREKVCRCCGIRPEDKIVLYAPTYRTPEKEVALDADALLACLNSRGGTWRLLFRAHRYQKESGGVHVAGEAADAGEYPDMQELLMAADMMITDYSSSVWDYSFLKRPCVLYVPDCEEYTRKNGFYVDIRLWPFPLAENQEELHRAILDLDGAKLEEAIRRHHRMMGSFESGRACESAAERIYRVCGR